MVVVILQMFEEKVKPTWDGGNIYQMFVEKVKPTWDGSSNITDVYGES